MWWRWKEGLVCTLLALREASTWNLSFPWPNKAIPKRVCLVRVRFQLWVCCRKRKFQPVHHLLRLRSWISIGEKIFHQMEEMGVPADCINLVNEYKSAVIGGLMRMEKEAHSMRFLWGRLVAHFRGKCWEKAFRRNSFREKGLLQMVDFQWSGKARKKGNTNRGWETKSQMPEDETVESLARLKIVPPHSYDYKGLVYSKESGSHEMKPMVAPAPFKYKGRFGLHFFRTVFNQVRQPFEFHGQSSIHLKNSVIFPPCGGFRWRKAARAE